MEEENESVDVHIIELKQSSLMCFLINLSLVTSGLIVGVRSAKLRQKLLDKVKDVSLSKATEVCRLFEKTAKQGKHLKTAADSASRWSWISSVLYKKRTWRVAYRRFSCDIISSQFCKSSYWQPPFWFPLYMERYCKIQQYVL